jgi:hypothetical protein
MEQVYQSWWMICQEINVFPRLEYKIFYGLYPFVTYLLTLPRIFCLLSFKFTEVSLLKRIRWYQFFQPTLFSV